MPTEEQRLAMQGAWKFRGGERPSFAATPRAGQESVWDYPRPPILEACTRHVQVRLGDRLIGDSRRAQRLLETASPPTFYIPPEDVDQTTLEAARGGSFCEWKGRARYWNVVADDRRVEQAAWDYPEAGGEFAAIAGWLAFYPVYLDCSVDGEPVRAQPGGFYGGWVTDDIVGPFKGEPGTGSW
jgi:uncharacterized protein (DUF427 family)